MSNDKKKVGLFDQFYNASTELIKQLKEPMIRRSIKRKFGSAIDDAMTKKLNAESEMLKQLEKLDNLDINKLLEFESTIEKADKSIDLLQKIYYKLFAEELSIED